MTDSIHTVVERYSKLAVLIAPLGSCSGDSRWEAAQALREAATLILELQAERDQARQLVTEANNSLYGSQGYFHSLNGGEFDKYHLATGIEKIKDHCREQWRELEALKAVSVSASSVEQNPSLRVEPSAEQISRIQSETIEACAKVAEDPIHGLSAWRARENIASAIRSLDKTGSAKTAQSNHSPSTLNTRTE